MCFFQTLVLLSFITYSCVAQQTAMQNFTNFLTGFWNNQNLEQPSNFLGCFDETSAQGFFTWLKMLYKTDLSIIDANDESFGQDEPNLEEAYQAIASNLVCGTKTPDFAQILSAYSMPQSYSNLSLLTPIYSTYGLAFPEIITTGIAEADIYISQYNSYKLAGQSIGNYLQKVNIEGQIQSENALNNQVLSFLNGLYLNLELSSPYLFAECMTQSNSEMVNFLYFYGNWSSVVQSGNAENMLTLTKNYFQTQGKTIFDQVPTDLFQCFETVPAYRAFKNKVGFNLNPLDPGFYQALTNYLNQMPGDKIYLQSMKVFYNYWMEGQYFKSGMTLGAFFKTDLKKTEFIHFPSVTEI